MLLTLATLASLALAQETDTTFAVQPGARLDVNNFGGEIAVRAWNENRVRIRASHSSRDRIDVSFGATTISVRSEGRRGPSQMVEYEISVPAWMALNLSGTYTDIIVAGTQAAVAAETVEGDITLDGGSGTVTLKSVEGGVTVTGTHGNVDANSVEGEIHITGASGEIVAETVDGDIVLENIQSSSVDANTVDGDITYDGPIRDNGRYRFATHDGDLAVSVQEQANVSVAVATFDGDFNACFPVQVTGQRKHRFSFTIGTGSARLELESFSGDIKLCRPGQLHDGGHDEDNDNDQ